MEGRSVLFNDGTKKTLGIMLPGEYEFGTEDKEIMEILSGEMEILLPDSGWKSVKGGDSFEVPAKSKFQLKICTVTDYCCSLNSYSKFIDIILPINNNAKNIWSFLISVFTPQWKQMTSQHLSNTGNAQ